MITAGQRLRIVDLEGLQAVDTLCYDAHDYENRYSAANTIRAQRNLFLTTGSELMSTDGDALATIVADTCGRHDTVGGACSAESNTCRFGHHTRSMHNCRDNFLNGLSRHGMGKRDLAPNINFFMNVPVTVDGHLDIVDGISAPGHVRGVAGRARRAVRDLELPAAQQSVQRLEPDTRSGCSCGTPDDERAQGARREPGRDRGAHPAHAARARDRVGGRVLRRRSARAACRAGRRSGAPRPRAAAAELPRRASGSSAAAAAPAPTPCIPGYGFLSENAGFARACEAAGVRVDRADAREPRGSSAARIRRATWPAPRGFRCWPAATRSAIVDDASRRRRRDRVPGDAQEPIGRRRDRHAPLRPPGRSRRRVRDGDAPGPRPLRRRRVLHRAVRRRRAPRGGADLRRRPRRRDRARRTRLLAAAPQPEGDRGDAGAHLCRPPPATGLLRVRDRADGVRGLPVGGHGRVRRRRGHRASTRSSR